MPPPTRKPSGIPNRLRGVKAKYIMIADTATIPTNRDHWPLVVFNRLLILIEDGMKWFGFSGCKRLPQMSWQERAMSATEARKFQPERFQDIVRAGWHQKPRFISTNLAFLPDGRLRITPYEDNTTWPIDNWAIGIEFSIIDNDDDRRPPEALTIRHEFGSCQITTQYKSLLPYPIPLVPTSRRSHRWWIEGMDPAWKEHYYFSARLVVVEVPGSYGVSLEDFLAVFYASDGRIVGQIAAVPVDYAWPRRCAYIPVWRTGSTAHTLMIPPTSRLFDIHRDLEGGYRTFEALSEPMDHWNVMALRKPGLTLAFASSRGLMWMNGRGARVACAAAVGSYKEELIAYTWSPSRHVEWCLDIEEQAEMLEGGEDFTSWRIAAAAAEKKISDMMDG